MRILTGITKPYVVLAIHSFTPEYEGQKRSLEIGILFNHHSSPATPVLPSKYSFVHFIQLADYLSKYYKVALNEPYSGKDGFMFAVSQLEENFNKKANLGYGLNDIW